MAPKAFLASSTIITAEALLAGDRHSLHELVRAHMALQVKWVPQLLEELAESEGEQIVFLHQGLLVRRFIWP